tara:strand:- start:32 stop:220 length:189 start_codon:yes stop_codon:yes gene_type:complete
MLKNIRKSIEKNGDNSFQCERVRRLLIEKERMVLRAGFDIADGIPFAQMTHDEQAATPNIRI